MLEFLWSSSSRLSTPHDKSKPFLESLPRRSRKSSASTRGQDTATLVFHPWYTQSNSTRYNPDTVCHTFASIVWSDVTCRGVFITPHLGRTCGVHGMWACARGGLQSMYLSFVDWSLFVIRLLAETRIIFGPVTEVRFGLRTKSRSWSWALPVSCFLLWMNRKVVGFFLFSSEFYSSYLLLKLPWD